MPLHSVFHPIKNKCTVLSIIKYTISVLKTADSLKSTNYGNTARQCT